MSDENKKAAALAFLEKEGFKNAVMLGGIPKGEIKTPNALFTEGKPADKITPLPAKKSWEERIKFDDAPNGALQEYVKTAIAITKQTVAAIIDRAQYAERMETVRKEEAEARKLERKMSGIYESLTDFAFEERAWLDIKEETRGDFVLTVRENWAKVADAKTKEVWQKILANVVHHDQDAYEDFKNLFDLLTPRTTYNKSYVDQVYKEITSHMEESMLKGEFKETLSQDKKKFKGL